MKTKLLYKRSKQFIFYLCIALFVGSSLSYAGGLSIFAVNTDADGDGILDGIDNCTYVHNPDQLDTDGDGIGDVCDPPDVNLCNGNDLFFITDASGSVGVQGFEQEKAFVNTLIDSINGGPGGIRYGVLNFSNTTQLVWRLTQNQDKNVIKNAVNNMTFISSTTATRMALRQTTNQFIADSDPTRKKFIILITDGNPVPFRNQNPCDNTSQAVALRNDLAALDIKVKIVGIGTNWDPNILQCLVDDPAEDIIFVNNFGDLDSISSSIFIPLDADMDGMEDCFMGTDFDGDGWFSLNGDCDDHDSLSNPNALEICDGKDNNCDGVIDEGFDADGDSIADCFDNCAGISNSDQADDDGDNVGNVCDNCPNTANSDQTDTDGDSFGDACDTCPTTVDGIANTDASGCNCLPGYFEVRDGSSGTDVITACQICPPGKYCPDGVDALDCAAGSYNDVEGATECILCPAGRYSDVTGATFCQTCVAGSFNGSLGATSCTPCGAGSFSNIDGAIECTLCPVGTSSNVVGATSCVDCPAGQFSDAVGSTVCQSCPAGSFSNITGASSCLLCPAGTSSSIEGATSCVDCPPGEYSSEEGSTTCLSCPAGAFSSQSGSTSCELCPIGTSNNTTGTSSCQSCPAGSFSDAVGSTECQSCPAGSFSDVTGASSCQLCPAGISSDVVGATACVDCPAGQFSSVQGSTTCLSCPAGSFSSQTGSTACDLCQAGTSSNIEGASACVDCPPGAYSDVRGALECLLCPSGTYNPISTATSCLNCDPGFISDPGATECDPFDIDLDGVPDVNDNCPSTPNADQVNSDNDANGDACDICPFDANDDIDQDSVCGDVDNCPDIANADQLDSDNDGNGDACDVCPLDANDDEDGDGLCADVDNCPTMANPDQADGDGDGVGDVCDNCPTVANSDQADDNGNGIGNLCEYQSPCVYAIMSGDKVELDETTVHSGGVGSNYDNNNGIKLKDNSSIVGFANANDEDVDNSSSVGLIVNPYESFNLPPFEPYVNNGGSNVTVQKNQSVTLTDANYDKLKVKKNATITFDGHETVYIKDLDLDKEVTIIFNQCTNIIVDKKGYFKKEAEVNVNGNYVVSFYIEDDCKIEEGSTIHANIYAEDKMDVKGKSNNPTELVGLFISGDKFKAKKDVNIYEAFDCESPCLPGNGSRIAAQTATINQTLPNFSEALLLEGSSLINAENWKIFPNPASDVININVEAPQDEMGSIRIFNAQGLLVYDRKINLHEGLNKTTISTIDLPNGVYYLRYQNTNIKKVMILK